MSANEKPVDPVTPTGSDPKQEVPATSKASAAGGTKASENKTPEKASDTGGKAGQPGSEKNKDTGSKEKDTGSKGDQKGGKVAEKGVKFLPSEVTEGKTNVDEERIPLNPTKTAGGKDALGDGNESQLPSGENPLDAVKLQPLTLRGIPGAILGCVLVGGLFCLVSFVTTSWAVFREPDSGGNALHIGLWETCNCTFAQQPSEPWFKSVQAMVTISLICMLGAVIWFAIFMCLKPGVRRIINIILIIDCFMAVVCLVIGLTVFGVKQKEHLSAASLSFIFASISCVTSCGAGVLAVVQLVRG